jgi:hypothetical protein
MNVDQTVELFKLIIAFDNRNPDAYRTVAWAELLQNVPYADAVDAVKTHFATSDAYLMPVHIIRHAKKLRQERLEAFGAVESMRGQDRIISLVTADPRSPEWIEQVRVLTALVAAGEVAPDMDREQIARSVASVTSNRTLSIGGGGS